MNAILQTTTARDALVDAVRAQILSGDLAPGTPLTETALSSAFGVARPTVRSALQVLKERRYAHQSHGRSLIVPEFGIDDVRDLYLVRLPLELETVGIIVERQLPLDAAERRLDEMEKLPPGASWSERVQAHTAFHVAIVDSVGSPRLSRIYLTLQDEMQLCLAQIRNSYPDPETLACEHRTLLTDIQSLDLARAQAAMRTHLARAVDNFAST